MKIAHLIPQFYPHAGGAEICIHNVCKKIAEKGHTAVIVTTTPPPPDSLIFPYEIIYLSSKTCGLFRKFPYFIGRIYLHHQLFTLQKKYNFDLWQVTNGWPLGSFAIGFFKKYEIPSILRCCGDDIQTLPEINYGVRLDKKVDKIIQKTYPLFDGFVALTKTVEDEYLKLGIPKEKIKIIPNGVDNKKFTNFNAVNRNEICKKYGIEPHQKIILTVGRYHPKKGFDLIPKIAEVLKEKKLDFVWIIAGKNVCEIRKKFPESHNLNLIFTEDFTKVKNNQPFDLPPDELIKLYCSSDLFALPTLIETFGMVLIEAMAAGLPIVTTNAPGVKDVIKDKIQGFTTKVNDPVDFAEKIFLVFSNPELYKTFSQNAKLQAKEYDWDLISQRYIDFYFEICKQKN